MGFRNVQEGVIPDDLAWHETIEITQGITPWFELGGYLFMSGNRGQYGMTYVGDHIRPRFRAPVSCTGRWGSRPDLKLQFNVSKKVGIGVEYYTGIGSFQSPYTLSQQFHQIGPAVDLDVSPDYEINFGYMFGLTPGTVRGIVKLILGRRVAWKKRKPR
ncbi:unnamed protein product [Sphagnum jensenii]|uniref:Uncharacterized protein n=1 Tax=Sphagnum jensenii TaxID=128206 RepID=A0ABP0VIM8_9BRYO